MTALLLLGSALRADAEELQAVVSGRYRDPVSAYKVGRSYYLNARDAGTLYGGQVYWYPVSGRVQLSFRGRPAQFLVGSEEATVQGRKVPLGSKVLLRSNQAFIPLSFFLAEDFSALAGADTQFNERTKLLSVDRRASVGPPRWFSYPDRTRIAFELHKGLTFSTAARGLGGVEIAIPLGLIETSEQADLGDGLVERYTLRQDAGAARLSVRLARSGLKWKVRELSEPRRVVLDVFSGEEVFVPVAAAAPQRPAAGGGGEQPVPSKPAPPLAVTPLPPPAPRDEEAPKPSVGPVIAGVARDGRVKRRIVIDAGHGGKDGGATGRRGTLEKDIALAAAKELAKLLKEEGVFEVMLTRSDDVFVPLADRSRLADEFKADLFLSLHCNASTNGREDGYEVYFLSETASDPAAQRMAEIENAVLELEGKSPQDEEAAAILTAMTKTENINASSELAALISRALQRRVDLVNRGVKQAAFYVLRGTHAPAVLFEMAFISNRKDEAKLESKKYRRKIVDGVYAGVLDYARRQGWVGSARRSGK